MNQAVIFIFLDGFGLAEAGPSNPNLPHTMPFLESLLGRPLVKGQRIYKDLLLLEELDSCMGVPGLPQSATGQTAIFTGINAAKVLGYHCPAFPNVKLVDLIKKHNIYQALRQRGASSVFANAYSPLYFQLAKTKKRRHSVTTHCVLGAGLPFLTLEDLKLGQAVFWDITREALALYPLNEHFEPIAASEAAQHLAFLARQYNFTLFECFMPDLIGHKKEMRLAIAFLKKLDDFLKTLASETSPTHSIILTSDHGNMEDLSHGTHTLNPVPLLVLGKAAPFFRGVESIDQIAGCLITLFNKKKGCFFEKSQPLHFPC